MVRFHQFRGSSTTSSPPAFSPAKLKKPLTILPSQVGDHPGFHHVEYFDLTGQISVAQSPPLSLPDIAIREQHHRAGPSLQ
jgi:hypothetical protein